MDAFFYGFGTGIVLSLTLGTVFFALIQSSLDHGYKSGVYIASGVVLSDTIFIGIAYWGVSKITNLEHIQTVIGLAGSVLLIILGLSKILREKQSIIYPKTKWGSMFYFVGSGFFLNGLNPVNFIFWTAIAAQVNIELEYSFTENIIFFVSSVSAIFLMEVLIAFFASRLKRFFSQKVMMYINKVTGIIFLSFGIFLLINTVYKML